MTFSANNMTGLVILSLGILGIIISFLVIDRKKYVIALMLSMLVVLMGAYQYVSTAFRQWQTSRQIADLQKQQRLNLQALQDRLKAPQPPAPAAAPATKTSRKTK